MNFKELYGELGEKWLSEPRIICGIMSGTSLDGIDTAVVKFWRNASGKFAFKLIFSDCLPFSDNASSLIFKALNDVLGIDEISRLNFLLAGEYSDAVRNMCRKHDFPLEKIEAAGVHGQTLWHEPNGAIPSTLQLGSVSALSGMLGIPVVGDFRTADIVEGGQGAPLVPVFDSEFLSEPGKNIIALNIGGMSNISCLPSVPDKEKLVAFDTGPGNVLIDSYMLRHLSKSYDMDGETASKGKINRELLDILRQNEFIRKTPPKSTGREEFNYSLIEKALGQINENNMQNEDIAATLTYFTAWSIAENIRLFTVPDCRIIVSGGGSRNPQIMFHLRNELPAAEIVISDELGIPADGKEAICFAFLAYRTLGGLSSNIKSVTGAGKEVVLGLIAGI